ncbi:ATP-binding protein [Pseudescherichia vulneris]|uniref:ATP-binding protein n=1 Tax=Pseudescherichia vulneris TaxID=566 RepID=UPI0028B0EE78|nr:ATP-binding protein [Pseudescherichia vulneris]
MQKQMMPLQIQEMEQRAAGTLASANTLINRSYLAEMRHYPVQPLEEYQGVPIHRAGDIRVFRIERIVQENKQSVLESTTAAYTALGAAGYSVFLLLKSDGRETDVYIGTRGTPGKMLGQNSGELLNETFKGHFPGSKLVAQNAEQTAQLLDGALAQKENPSSAVTAVTGVPSLATEDSEHFMQGLEHFIDAAESRVYQAIILAEPVTPPELDRIRTGYEKVATQLSILAKRQYSFGVQDSDSVGLSISEGLSHSLGESLGMTVSQGTSFTRGTNHSTSVGSSSSESTSGVIADIMAGYKNGSQTSLGAAFKGVLQGAALNRSHSTSMNESTTVGTSETQGSNASQSESRTLNRNDTTTRTDSQTLNKTSGSSQQISLEVHDKTIENLLAKIDHHLDRVNEARTYGGWQTAAYFIGDSTASSESLASIFLGLMRGTRSSTEDFALTTWNSQSKRPILDWLSVLAHPLLKPAIAPMLPIDWLTPATLVSGKEMAIQLSLPRRSTSSVAVLHTQSFGRKVQRLDGPDPSAKNVRTLRLGQMRHLWNDLDTAIELDVDQLSSHMFITGSTGAGKSNTVYAILEQLGRHSIPFLVIEPAKGEYKQVFGQRDDVSVFGTNGRFSPLLRINPFRFPESTHVFEHIDRLVDVFSMCWPMYAAMPAVLKDAILQAYTVCGWDLVTSENHWQPALFPTFADLLEQLRQVIEQSEWSQEVKSNYIGSLVTRVNSLTNGLNGQIFSGDEIDNAVLFDSNTVIDLSRIGSQETKSFITGILVIRLNEHRAAMPEMNQALRHVTVLEEAHHLLKRSAGGQGSEGADITGKAVEMLANAIAEMRTWGEGFIIADQSPSAVDMAAIRNTNTKIIMRLPEEMDRRTAGKSATLSDEQLDELARLPRGVAVVYQNDWLEPVLCRVSKFESPTVPWRYTPPESSAKTDLHCWEMLLGWLLSKRLPRPVSITPAMLPDVVDSLPLPTRSKILLRSLIAEFSAHRTLRIQHDGQFRQLAKAIVDLLDCRREVVCRIRECADFRAVSDTLDTLLNQRIGHLPQTLRIAVQQCLMKDLSGESETWLKIYAGWRKHIQEIVQ